MDNNSIIKQGTDICLKQIQYTEFGLKQSQDTTYLVTVLNILNVLTKDKPDIEYKDRQNIIPILNKIGIKI